MKTITRCDVPLLQDLAIQKVGPLVLKFVPLIVSEIKSFEDRQKITTILQRRIEALSEFLIANVPFYLYDDVAKWVLKSLAKRMKRVEEYSTELMVLVSFVEVVLNSNLKSMDFLKWPKLIREVIFKNMHRLNGLKYLDIFCDHFKNMQYTMYTDYKYTSYILGGIRAMKNLRSLQIHSELQDVDIIVQSIAENCPLIEHISLSDCKSVTDCSIPPLLKCGNLQNVDLNGTSITAPAIAELIAGLPKLEQIGLCNKYKDIIECLSHKHNNCRPFGLKKISCDLVLPDKLGDVFPKVQYISIHGKAPNMPTTINFRDKLNSLHNLSTLRLQECSFHRDDFKQLLQVRGRNITELDVYCNTLIMSFEDFLVDVSQYCPNLKNFNLIENHFTKKCDSCLHSMKLKMKTFRNLEHFWWYVIEDDYIEIVLADAINIRLVETGFEVDVTHSNIVNILNTNPMKQLEKLKIHNSSDMSTETVQLLLNSCTNLKLLSDLDRWRGIPNENNEPID